MAKDHRKTAAEAWGTLEELLLACAVNRHGTKSWDSIAMEVQNRTSNFPSLTSQHCIDKFNDLKRRYKPPLADASAGLVVIIDELRKTRVEELRREVQERDVSILSLESKVKKLEEERERSAKEDADLPREKKLSLDTVAGKPAAGEESGDERENRSFNESNSTDQQKAEATTARFQNDAVDGGPTAQPDPQIKNETEPGRSGSDPGAIRDWSCNGKSEDVDDDGDNGKQETAVKESRFKSSHTTGGLGESNELGESVGESKREEKEKEKQNSDVQSSASLSLKTKKRRHRVVRRGCAAGTVAASSSGDSGGGVASSSAEEQDGGDEISPATKRAKAAVKSEPLIKLIETIRSHRLGSVFEQRLRSQESQRYKNLIRQHIDLQTIQSRLDRGIYSSSLHKFFRDLLLLFNNGVVFFKKNSSENNAACELRALILKEMVKKLGKRKLQTTKPEPETKQPTSFSKPNKSSTIVACGKGNAAKSAAAAIETASKKGSSSEKKDKESEEKPKGNPKKVEPAFPKIEDKTTIRKKRTKDQRSVATNRNTTTSTKNTDTKHKFGGNELSSHDALETKVEKKGNTSTSKRQGAASFLKRMKQNSPSQANDNESSEEEPEEVEEEEEEEVEKEESKGKEEKGKKGGKNGNKEGNVTERVTRSSKGRNVKGESGRGKRTVGRGRPPKKESPAAETPTTAGKRGRDSGGGDGGSGGGRAKKRTRR